MGVGYALGTRSLRLSQSKANNTEAPKEHAKKTDEEEDNDSEDEEAVADGDLSAVKPGFFEECKLVRH